MTNQAELQKELKETVKEGIKPSDLKKLKRSKSSESLPLPKPEISLQKSKSATDILQPPSLTEQIKSLKQDLVFSQTTAQNYLERLQSLEAKNDQLKATANSKI